MLLRISEIESKYKISHNSMIAWESQGKLKSYRTIGNHRRYLETDIEKLLQITAQDKMPKVCYYARVSTQKQIENLERQIERLKTYCSNKEYKNIIGFQEIASGLNENRRQFHKMIDLIIKKKVNIVVVEYKDRLSRFGLRLLLHLLEGFDCKLEVIENKAQETDNNDLVEDIMSLIASFSGRLYGARGGRKKLKEDLNI